MADEPDNPFTDTQLEQFGRTVAEVRAAGHQPELVHVCNSAATLTHPEAESLFAALAPMISDPRLSIVPGPTPALSVDLTGPKGTVRL